jgi:hypothetical protein
MISVERLEKLSNELSFEAATIERVVRLIDVLDRLTKDREIGHLFPLKGGTALCARSPPFVATVESGQRRIDVIEFLDLPEAVGFDPIDVIKKFRAAVRSQ